MARHANAWQRAPRGFLLAQNQQVVKRPLVIGTDLRCRLGGRERRVDPPRGLAVRVADTVRGYVVRVGVTVNDSQATSVTMRLVQMFRHQRRLAEHAQHGNAHE